MRRVNCLIVHHPYTGSTFGHLYHSIPLQDTLLKAAIATPITDESSFNLGSDYSCVRVSKPGGERLNPDFTVQWHTIPTTGVMVLGAIAYDTWSLLILMYRTMTAERLVTNRRDMRSLGYRPHTCTAYHSCLNKRRVNRNCRMRCRRTSFQTCMPQ
ncbi:hypothetical protein TNCV_4576801 [Trichonephila clavipes]|nr:hypothetical protein TNCV_4576801 [Trichonephila clavipes]